MAKKTVEISIIRAGVIRKEKVIEETGTANFFGHAGHIHDGLVITHRGTGYQLGAYSIDNAKTIMAALEECGINWAFTDLPVYGTKVYEDMYAQCWPILSAYKRTDGSRWKALKQGKVKA